MFKKPLDWLQRKWWGIAVAYFIVFITSYLAIWQLAEPLGVPDDIQKFPSFVSSRIFIHIFLTLIISAHITIILDVWLRYSEWTGMAIRARLFSADFIKHQELLKVMRRISHLQEEFSLSDWKITYSIDEDGNELLFEEMTIVPSKEAVYFYYKGYSIPDDNLSNYDLDLTVRNVADGTSLAAVELFRSPEKIHYAILLDPPSRIKQPKRIAIECRRKGTWKELIDSHRTDGTLKANHDSDQLVIEFVAPLGRKWKAFHPAPEVGDIEIRLLDGSSRIKWQIPNSKPRTFAYEVFLEPKTS